MPQFTIKRVRGVLYAHSFTTGPVKIVVAEWVIKNQDDAMAYACYLAKHGQREEGNAFLDDYCS